MTAEDALNAAKIGQASLTAANAAQEIATKSRDAAVLAAADAGESLQDIADALDLSLQQIRRIIDQNAAGHPVVDALRQEVMASNARYEDLIEDDQKFVDIEVEQLASERGISLD